MLDIALEAYYNLTKKQRQVWDLYMRGGISEYKAAEILGLTRNAVHDRLNKARKSFKRYIKQFKRGTNGK